MSRRRPPAADARPAPAACLGRASSATRALRELIELALQNNRDLRVAVLNIEQARAQYQIRRADQLPTREPGRHRQPPARPTSGGIEQRLHRRPGDRRAGRSISSAAWRSLKDAALAQYLATEEARRAAQTSLVAAVASTWLSLQTDEELLALTQQHAGHARGFAAPDQAALRQRRHLGAGPAAGRVADGRRALHAGPAAARQRALDVNALTLLVGQPLPANLLPRRPAAASRRSRTCPPACRPTC